MKTTSLLFLFILCFVIPLSAQEEGNEKEENDLDTFQNWNWFRDDFSNDINDKVEEFIKEFKHNFEGLEDNISSDIQLYRMDSEKFKNLLEEHKFHFDDLDFPTDSIKHFFKNKTEDLEVYKFHLDPLNENMLEELEERWNRYFDDEEIQEKIKKFKQFQKYKFEEILEELHDQKVIHKKAI